MLTPTATAAGIFLASLMGSVHCAGMCGGFLCVYAGTGPTAQPTALSAHVAYHGGRLVSYLTLGAVAGWIGGAFSTAALFVGLQRGATLLAGALMVLWALSTLLAYRGVVLAPRHAPLAWQRMLGGLLHAVRGHSAPVRGGLMGLLTTLLPCGWLYVFVAAAGGSGSVANAMGLMTIFWLGTVPALVAVGVGVQSLAGPMRRHLPVVSAVVVLGLGLLSMAGHLAAPGMVADAHVGAH